MNIFQSLPSSDSDLLWKYNERQDLYEKYTQYVSPMIKQEKKMEVVEKPIIKEKDVIVPKMFQIESKDKEVTKVTEKIADDKPQKKEPSNKTKKPSPMQVIIKLSDNVDVNSEYIRSKLIELISTKYFHTAFGVKKSSDVMKGITENKWNKSYAQLISFLFDVSFIYLNKVVSYDSEKTYDTTINI
jgi:hypothetical protein